MRMIFLLVLLLNGITSFSQEQLSKMTVKENYLKKSKSQKKTANVLLIGGGALVATAFIYPRGKPEYHNAIFWSFTTYPNDGLKAGLLLTGTLSMLGSVPFYLSSSKNKRRAAAITVRVENRDVLIPNHNTLRLKKQPSLTFKLPL